MSMPPESPTPPQQPQGGQVPGSVPPVPPAAPVTPPVAQPAPPAGMPQMPPPQAGMPPAAPPGGMPPAQTPQFPSATFVYPNAPLTYIEAEQAAVAGWRPALKLPTWGLGDVWITLALIFIVQFAAVIAIMVAYAVFDPSAVKDGQIPQTALVSLGLTAFMWVGMGGWPWVAAKFKGNGIKIDFGLRWSARDIGLGVLWGVVAFVVAMILGVITTMLFGEFSSAAGDEASQYRDSVIMTALFSLAVAFGAPFFEELAFRGLFFSSLAKRGMGAFACIVIPAFVFALFHMEWVRFWLLFGVGVVLGVARWQSKSLTTSIVAHMMNNLPGAIGLLLISFGFDIPV